MKPKILAFAGSTRKDSFNKRLVKIAARGAKQAGAEVTFLDLRDHPLPLYDEDLETEQGIPDNAIRLKRIFNEHHGLLISSPEYNSSISAVLKNTIDWVTRPEPGEPPLRDIGGKTAALLGTSPGGLGGLRGLVHLRAILGNIRIMVIPEQLAVPSAMEAFDGADLKDASQREAVEAIGVRLAQVTAAMCGVKSD